MILNGENWTIRAPECCESLVATQTTRWLSPTIISIAAVAVCAACSSDDFVGGKVETTVYPAVTSPTAVSSTGSSTVPREFPSDVPVVGGRYVLEANPESNAKTLLVSGIDKAAIPRANQLLIESGYDRHEFQGTTVYLGQKYIITLSEDSTSDLPTLRYTVVPIASVPGIPNIPTFTIPTFFENSTENFNK
ncbi:hypothetical protein ACNO8X_22710 [Mycobacterium sp. PDNC021]|uniref:hypothetical protein n=1 Tax=Mycobacterium sp. PDNC021 TaxID=3391399 RepID=UPI003AAA7C38